MTEYNVTIQEHSEFNENHSIYYPTIISNTNQTKYWKTVNWYYNNIEGQQRYIRQNKIKRLRRNQENEERKRWGKKEWNIRMPIPQPPHLKSNSGSFIIYQVFSNVFFSQTTNERSREKMRKKKEERKQKTKRNSKRFHFPNASSIISNEIMYRNCKRIIRGVKGRGDGKTLYLYYFMSKKWKLLQQKFWWFGKWQDCLLFC